MRCQSVAHIGKTLAVRAAGGAVSAILRDVQLKTIGCRTPHAHRQVRNPAVRLDAVFEGVFEQGLGDHRRDFDSRQWLGDLPLNSDASLETRRHDVGLVAQDGQLVGQRMRGARRLLRRLAKEGRQLAQQRVGARHVLVHQGRDQIERVEQKMRLQLLA